MLRELQRRKWALLHARPRRLAANTLSSHRNFASNHPLLLITRNTAPRPRLPFLAQSSPNPRQLLLQRQIARVLSTENKQYVKQQTWFGVKLCIAALVVINLGGLGLLSLSDELVEREHPSPPEWSYLTRMAWRGALDESDATKKRLRPVDTGKVGNYWLTCLRRLEDTTSDGQGLVKLRVPEGEEHEVVRDVAPVALDVTNKSDEWKAGYVEVILELGKAAEATQHLVYDRSRAEFFPESSVVGPSNPRPRKLPSDIVPPKEEDCIRGIPDPAVIYHRVTHGTGFTPKQRIDAHHALANWLHFTKADSAADAHYTQAVDIALSARPDPATTPNLLAAHTQQAAHLARTHRVRSALPIFLSSLSALQSISTASPPSPAPSPPVPTATSFLSRFFRPDTYPLPPLSGNESLSVLPPAARAAHEAELRLYVGEILFATGGTQRADGLAWTREAVELSAGLLARIAVARKAGGNVERVTGLGGEAERRVRETLRAGVGNWEGMVGEMERIGKEERGSWWGGKSRGEQEVERAREARGVLEGLKGRLIAEGVVDASAFVAW